MAAGARGRPQRGGFDRLAVFSVDDRSVQLHWAGSPAGPFTLGVGSSARQVDPNPPLRRGWMGGPGAVVIDGLPDDTTLAVWAESPGGRVDLGEVRTLPTPPGRLLGAIATVNDLHVGEASFGPTGLEDIWPLPEGGAYSLRCLAAAIGEAEAWGADLLVAKGDLTRDSEPGEFEVVGRLLAGSAMPVEVVLGNHDVRHDTDGAGVLARFGIDATPATRVRDLPGLRLVMLHSPTTTDHWGVLDRRQLADLSEAAGDAPGACMVVSHHPPLTTGVTTHYPPGLRAAPSAGLLQTLAEDNPASVVVAGHTHRNRLRWSRGIVCAETGSTKDHPGGWTGYRIHEGGIVQTARRTALPDVIAWTERTAGLMARQWGRWSPGVLADRSWSLQWPN